MNPGYVRRVMQLAFLSPKLVEEILDSRETICGGVVEITEMVMPLSWAQQADLLKKGPRRPAEHVSGQSYLAHIEADDKFWGGVSE
jgi:hypothetical protein